MKVAIINYKMGNTRSISNAIEYLGYSVNIIDNPLELKMFNSYILPGVGAYGEAMNNLKSQGWVEAMYEEIIIKRKPLLGICLGMQLLSSVGTESGNHKGLDWIKGITKSLDSQNQNLRIPHIGWNDVEFNSMNGLYKGLNTTKTFYFVHSYYFQPYNKQAISGMCNYGINFPASIEYNNIFGTQYHPEKSHKVGLAVLLNFLKYKG